MISNPGPVLICSVAMAAATLSRRRALWLAVAFATRLACVRAAEAVGTEDIQAHTLASCAADGSCGAAAAPEQPASAETRIAVDPIAQVRLMGLAIQHVERCLFAAGRMRIDADLVNAASVGSLVHTVVRNCISSGPTDHGGSCGAEVRAYTLGRLVDAGLLGASFGGCCAHAPPPSPELLGAILPWLPTPAAGPSLGEGAETMLALSGALHAQLLALARGESGEALAADRSQGVLAAEKEGLFVDQRLFALLVAAQSPFVRECSAQPPDEPRALADHAHRMARLRMAPAERLQALLALGEEGGEPRAAPSDEARVRLALARGVRLITHGRLEAGAELIGLCLYHPVIEVPQDVRAVAWSTLKELCSEETREHGGAVEPQEYRQHLVLVAMLVHVRHVADTSATFLRTAIELAPPRLRPGLERVLPELEAAALSHPAAAKWRDRNLLVNAARAIRPELRLFAECARALVLDARAPAGADAAAADAPAPAGDASAAPIFLATDNTPVGRYLLARLGASARMNERIGTRMEGFDERLSHAQQTRDAMLDLVLLARSRALLVTHRSTYSMLAAGMHGAALHAVAHPAVLSRCAYASSPLASHTHTPGLGDAETGAAGERQREAFLSGDLGALSCRTDELGEALNAVSGSFGPHTGGALRFVGELAGAADEADEEQADARARLARAQADDAARVAALIANYTQLHARALGAGPSAADGCAGGAGGGCGAAGARLLMGVTYCNNIGNRAFNLLAYVLLGMATGRALVIDPSWLPGFDFPLGLDVHALPEHLGAAVRARLGSAHSRRRAHWIETEPGYCSELISAECAGDAAVCVPAFEGAPHTLHVAANPQMRAWYREHVGLSGAGLRALMRWLFVPSAELVAEAEALERELCGGVRACEVGVHVRRGRMANDYFFPEDGARGRVRARARAMRAPRQPRARARSAFHPSHGPCARCAAPGRHRWCCTGALAPDAGEDALRAKAAAAEKQLL